MRKEKKGKGQEKTIQRYPDVWDKNSSLTSLFSMESRNIAQSIDIIENICKRRNVNINQIIELIKNKDKYASLPVGIFRSQFSPLEAIVRYMKDFLNYSFIQIAEMLSRDHTTIWTTYHNSLKKGKPAFDLNLNDMDFRKLRIKKEDLAFPVSVFLKRALSVLESLSLYLRQKFGLNYHTIGLLLQRDERTIWTAVNRAKKKIEEPFLKCRRVRQEAALIR